MNQSKEALIYLFAFLMVLFLIPSSSHASGFLNNLLNNKTVGNIVNKVENKYDHHGSSSNTSPRPSSSTSTSGNGVVLHESAPPMKLAHTGGALDILGVSLGMTMEEANRALKSHYKIRAHAVNGTFIRYQYKSIMLKSAPYTSSIMEHITKNATNEITTAYLGTPAIGSTVMEIQRSIVYHNTMTAPTITGIETALDNKYGPGTRVEKTPGYSPVTNEKIWIFGKHGLIRSVKQPLSQYAPCIGFKINLQPDRYNEPTGLENIKLKAGSDAYSAGQYACVDASYSPASSDTSRVGTLIITVKSPALQVQDINQTLKQMRSAALASYKTEAKPETPTL